MKVFQDLASIDGIGGLVTTSSENLRTFYSHLSRKTNNMSCRNIMNIKKIQFFLKYLQQRGCYEIGVIFDYFSIDDNYFFNFACDPSHDLSSGVDPRPFFTSSAPRKNLDSF